MSSAPQAKSAVQSLSRAFGLLHIIADAGEGITLGALAQKAELAPSTTHRLLGALHQSEMVEFDEALGVWQIGLGAFSIGSAYLKRRDVAALARVPMRQLVRETGETANLAVLNQNNVIFVAQVECDEAMRMAVKIGSAGPLHASAVGKAMLAFLPHSDALNMVEQAGFTQLTQHTIYLKEKFAEELKNVQKQGFAVDDEEQSLGLKCIAAPIFNEFGEPICALSISGPKVRVSDQRAANLAKAVIGAAHDVTARLGGRKPE